MTLLAGSATVGRAQESSGRTDVDDLLRLSEKLLSFSGSDEPGRHLDWLRDFDAFTQSQGLTLELGGVVSGSGVGLGFEHTLWRDADDTVGWQGQRTYKGYQELGLFHTRKIEGLPGGMLSTVIEYRDLPQERLYGLGGDSRLDNRTDFRLTEKRVQTELGWNLADELGLSFRGSFRNVETGPGTDASFPTVDQLFPADAVPGFRASFNYAGFGIALRWDRRDRPGYPRRGTLLAGEFEQLLGVSDNAPSYRRFSVEAHHFLPLPGYDHRLATRALVGWVDHDDSVRLPFFSSRGLGGSRTLRSFPLNRFRGENIALATVEYRAAILPDRLDAVLFWDTGGVYSHLRELDVRSLQHSFGAGIRLLRNDRILVRLDVARGSEGTRLVLSFGGTF